MLTKILKGIIRKRFGKSIHDYITYKAVSKLHLLIINILPEEHIFNIYIFNLTIIGRILSQYNGPLIIIEDNGR